MKIIDNTPIMKIIDNTPIENFDVDWGDPDGTGMKEKSKEQVQAFIKKKFLGLGYSYVGIATPATTPMTITEEDKVFYIAVEEGDYTGFGQSAITELTILKSEEGRWVKEGLGIVLDIDDKLTELDNKGNQLKEKFTILDSDSVQVKAQIFSDVEKAIATDNLGLDSAVKRLKKITENDFCIVDSDKNILAIVSLTKGLDAVALGDNIKKIVREISREVSTTTSTTSNGFYVTDKNGNILLKLSDDGDIDAINLGKNLTSKVDNNVNERYEIFAKKTNIINYAAEVNKQYAELNNLKEELSSIARSLESVKDSNGNTFSQQITIPMASQSENIDKAVIKLSLHYGLQIGDTRWDDVFFGENVRKDFSDVRIKDADGNILPTKMLHSGNYEVVKDSNIKGFYMSIPYKDEKVYACIGKRICVTSDEFVNFTELGVNQSINVSNRSFFVDSENGVWFMDADTHIVYVCYPINGVYDFTNQIAITDLRSTNSIDNEIDVNLYFNFPVQDSNGYLYFGVYQENFNAVIFKSVNPIENGGLLPNSQGEYVYECYNQERAYQDDGVTLDYDKVDQHIHMISIFTTTDKYGNNVDNIIATIDNSMAEKGPNIISSIDGGNTWVSFRDTIDLDWKYNARGHDYSFSAISEDNSYTVCIGESAVLGGYAIQKMYTRVNGEGRIIPFGLAYPTIAKNDGRKAIIEDDCIIIPTVSVYPSHNNSIVISTDCAKTWKTIYSSFSLNENGVGAGVRYFTDKILLTNADSITPCRYGLSSTSNLPSIRFYRGGNHYYGEILVEVGDLIAGEDKILHIESGYLASQVSSNILTRDVVATPVWSLPLNEGSGNIVTDNYGNHYEIKGDFQWDIPDNNMQFGNVLPPQKDYRETGGLKLGIGAYIELGQIPYLRFNRDFSLVMWIAYGNLAEGNYTNLNDDYYYKRFPIIGCDEFSIGRQNAGFYVGGKDSGTFTRGEARLIKNPHLYMPIMVTVSDDAIPSIDAYRGDRQVDKQKVVLATSWTTDFLSQMSLRVGTPETDTESAYGEINKNFYIYGISFYDRVLTREEFMSICYGCCINNSFNNLIK